MGKLLLRDPLGAFRFANGIMGQGSWCFNVSGNARDEETTIYGSNGLLSFPVFDGSHIALKIAGKKEEVLHFDMPRHIQQPLIQTAVDELMGMGKCLSTGVSGARANWVIERMRSKKHPLH